MASPIDAPDLPELPLQHPSIARINDVWLDGSHHDEAAVEYAAQIELCAPHIPYLVRASRALAGRMVRYLVEHGVRQFIDLGSGIPTREHVHEVARAVAPGARVVYVDIDPDVVADGRRILSGDDKVAYLRADIRQPASILEVPEFRDLIDLTRPVGLLIIETLLYLRDDEDPWALLASYADALPSGSYVGLTHSSESAELRAGLDLFNRMFGAPPAMTLRDLTDIERFFTGLTLVDPGIVPVPLWKPSTDEEVGRNPELAHMHSGLARKP